MTTDDGHTPRDDAGQKARRAGSFGTEAAAYAEHRPDHPVAGVGGALEPALTRFGGTLDVLILDAGERAELLGRVRGCLRARPETSGGAFDLEIVTLAQRCQRRAE